MFSKPSAGHSIGTQNDSLKIGWGTLYKLHSLTLSMASVTIFVCVKYCTLEKTPHQVQLTFLVIIFIQQRAQEFDLQLIIVSPSCFFFQYKVIFFTMYL